MAAVALIPARGGSKGIPRKNLAPVAGRPLLLWTLDAAASARSVERVVVSTDDDEIAAVAAAAGAEVLRRPPELAADDTPMLPVVLHAATELAAETIVLLQPTSPLRTAGDVDAAVELFVEVGADAIVSVVRIPHAHLPESQMRLVGTRLEALEPQAQLLRQGKTELYARNGPAVLVLRTAGLAARGLYGGDVQAYVMDARRSLDVDEAWELELADLLLSHRTGA